MNTPSPSLPSPVGILLIDKPAKRAVSSVTACRRVKRALIAGGKARGQHLSSKLKVGHAGTLDPLASGLLVILVGRAATRLCNTLMDGPKTYVAELDLLKSTVSDDLETETSINDVQSRPTLADVEASLEKFRGPIMQRPPAFSAIWIDGVRAFKLARKAVGKASKTAMANQSAQVSEETADDPVEDDDGSSGEIVSSAPQVADLPVLPERPVTIHELELVAYDWPYITVRVRCSKGTYIRSLVRDLGLAITGFPAAMTALRRTAVGQFDVADARHLESLPATLTQEDLMPVPENTSRLEMPDEPT